MNKDEEYIRLVDQLLISEIQAGARNFPSLVRSLPGIYPTEVLAALHRLKSVGRIDTNTFISLANYERKIINSHNKTEILRFARILPLPHPLDYDWRFEEESAGYLVRQCQDCTGKDEGVAFLGAPSAYLYAVMTELDRRLYLLDKNKKVIRSIDGYTQNASVLCCDILTDVIPQFNVGALVVDPPWYDNNFKGFLWVASHLATLGSNIFLSAPPIGTRPGIMQEREEMDEWIQTIGLERIEIRKGVLRYLTPPFENNALKSYGIFNFDRDWRCADLVIYRKISKNEAPRPGPTKTEDLWKNIEIRGISIRFRVVQQERFKDPTLRELIEGDILNTVSRRNEQRNKADVWTYGNRIYSCDGVHWLYLIAKAEARNISAVDTIMKALCRILTRKEKELVIKAQAQLIDLVEKEITELDNYYKEMRI